MTYGITAIRQVIHPLALRNSINLGEIFYKFFNIAQFDDIFIKPLMPSSTTTNDCCNNLNEEICAICERLCDLVTNGYLSEDSFDLNKANHLIKEKFIKGNIFLYYNNK